MKLRAFRRYRHILLLLVCINIFTILFLGLFFIKSHVTSVAEKRFEDILANQTKNMNFSQLSAFFKDLANAKGGAYAFQALTQAKLGPDIDTHLLGHVIGDELYKQKGINGIKDCTQDLRNACSHSMVIGAFTQLGEKALPKIATACEKAPGGKGAYTMCFHGLGHGVLAYYGYDFPKMIKSCEKTGTPAHNNQEFAECVGGGIMEIISGGGHDHSTWEKKRSEYLRPDDPLKLCSKSIMPERARSMCYTYITPYLWEASGGDINNISKENMKKAFLYCNTADDTYKDICYGGFGKEFIGFATDRDIRQVGSISTTHARIIKDLCSVAPTTQAIANCVKTTVGSLFWGGENDPHSSIRFCELYTNTPYENTCYQAFIENVLTYIDPPKLAENCLLLPKQYQKACTNPS